VYQTDPSRHAPVGNLRDHIWKTNVIRLLKFERFDHQGKKKQMLYIVSEARASFMGLSKPIMTNSERKLTEKQIALVNLPDASSPARLMFD
jgi:hypothetical protein